MPSRSAHRRGGCTRGMATATTAAMAPCHQQHTRHAESCGLADDDGHGFVGANLVIIASVSFCHRAIQWSFASVALAPRCQHATTFYTSPGSSRAARAASEQKTARQDRSDGLPRGVHWAWHDRCADRCQHGQGCLADCVQPHVLQGQLMLGPLFCCSVGNLARLERGKEEKDRQ